MIIPLQDVTLQGYPDWSLSERDEDVLASPGPEEVLHAHDVLVVIGTDDGIAGVRQIVDQG